jgi:hypothetical protein
MALKRDTTLETLKRLQKVKTISHARAAPLGEEMISFYKQAVIKRQGKLAKLAEVWGQLVPDNLSDHCALEAFSKGSLTVVVDSSSHLYELKQLLLSGLQQQLQLACKGAGLRKITLKAGRWYEGDEKNDRRVRFGQK